MAQAKFVTLSRNAKVGMAAATYASIRATCPDTCRLKDRGCYAQGGKTAITVRKLDAAPGGWRSAAKAEAAAIDAGAVLPGAPLRLHVSGDCRNATAARIVSAAAGRYTARGGGQVWTYTHAWRKVPRGAWGGVSVLASMEGTKHGRQALARGYAPAAVVEAFARPQAFSQDGVTWIPCPAQTTGATCTDCRLCFRADNLASREHGVAFAAHGSRKRRVLAVLNT